MNTYLGYYNVYISNYFFKRPQFDSMQIKISFIFQGPAKLFQSKVKTSFWVKQS